MTILTEWETDVSFDFDTAALAGQGMLAACEAERCPSGINRLHRGIDSPTDALSFPMQTYETPADFSHVEECVEGNFDPDTGELLLGDIVVSTEKVKEQAVRFGHSEKRELAFLILHSMLHLFGYDHETEEQREEMEARQRAILDGLGITRDT